MVNLPRTRLNKHGRLRFSALTLKTDYDRLTEISKIFRLIDHDKLTQMNTEERC